MVLQCIWELLQLEKRQGYCIGDRSSISKAAKPKPWVVGFFFWLMLTCFGEFSCSFSSQNRQTWIGGESGPTET